MQKTHNSFREEEKIDLMNKKSVCSGFLFLINIDILVCLWNNEMEANKIRKFRKLKITNFYNFRFHCKTF